MGSRVDGFKVTSVRGVQRLRFLLSSWFSVSACKVP